MKNKLEIKIYENQENLFNDLYIEIENLFKTTKTQTLGLATGSSPIPLYKKLVKEYKNNKISFENCTTFNLDEYCGLDSDDENSYAHFMYYNLFKDINLKKENINLIKGNCKNIKKEIKRYKSLLKKKTIDIQILGIGTDGHIAFNEPGTKKTSKVHQVQLDKRTIEDNSRFFQNDINKVPKSAITMGISDILKAKRVCLIACGENKKTPIAQLVLGKITSEFPASFLKEHKNVCLYLDKFSAEDILKIEDMKKYVVKIK